MKRKNPVKPETEIFPAYSDKTGNVYDYPGYQPAFRSGRRFTTIPGDELISLPFGSNLFSLPGRSPVVYDRKKGVFREIPESPEGEKIWAVSAFLSSGYLRTYLPAFSKEINAPVLPLWAYSGLATSSESFFVPAIRIDKDPRSDPELHQNDGDLRKAVKKIERRYPRNRLVRQLSYCSTEYRCLCARNFFLNRHEAPLPTTPACNARCLGCLSMQHNREFVSSMQRLDFSPTPEEIAEVMLHHIENTESPILSFGQGCEGEPLMRYTELAKAVELVRNRTNGGTINLNTNGSIPAGVKELVKAGLDSLRISLNSPTEKYYMKYNRPESFTFKDVLGSLELALSKGIFVSINLFVLPGFTDMETEVESLIDFLQKYPVNMIQTRNLNMDPDFYLDNIDFIESPAIGIRKLINEIKDRFPGIKLGYYNPSKEKFTISNT